MYMLARRPLALFHRLQLPLLVGGLVLCVLPPLWGLQQQNVNQFERQIALLKYQIEQMPEEDNTKEQIRRQMGKFQQDINGLPLAVATQKRLNQQVAEIQQQVKTLSTIALKDKLALQKDMLTLEKDRVNAQNAIYAILVQALGGTFFFVTAYLTWRNVRATEEKQVTERFSKAVDQLSNSSLEVRLGGIYALERIAKDSEKDHWTIMEILTAFIQSKSPVARPAGDRPSALAPSPAPDIPSQAAAQHQPITMDIQAALTVIGRRDVTKDPPDRQIDLSDTHCAGAKLGGASLPGANLRGANFSEAVLVGANLSSVCLSEANLDRVAFSAANLSAAMLDDAHLNGVQFMGTNLQEANLSRAMLCDAQLVGANLYKADCDGANLQNAYLTDADLREASLNAADLTGAFLLRTNLQKANLNTAIFSGTKLVEAQLKGAIALTQAQLDQAIIDAKTTLPADLTRPSTQQSQASSP